MIRKKFLRGLESYKQIVIKLNLFCGAVLGKARKEEIKKLPRRTKVFSSVIYFT